MLRKKCIEPLHEAWSEWKVFTELAKRLGIGETFPWGAEEELVAHELGPSGLTFDYLLNERPEGAFYQEKKYGISPGVFKTPSGKIEIYSGAIEQVGFNPLPVYVEPERSPRTKDQAMLSRYPLILSTGNRNYFYTHSQFRSLEVLRRENPEPLAELSPATAAQYAIRDGERAVIETNRGHVTMKVHVEERLADGVVMVPHGWPGEQNANLLTDTNCREQILGYPDMKSLMCSIRTE